MTKPLAGKVALVAGATRGAGRGIACMLGAAGATVAPLWTASEDFSAFQERIPGLFFNLGGTPRDRDPATVPTNHSPSFFVDEAALPIGVRALSNLAMDYLTGVNAPRRP